MSTCVVSLLGKCRAKIRSFIRGLFCRALVKVYRLIIVGRVRVLYFSILGLGIDLEDLGSFTSRWFRIDVRIGSV